MANARLNFFFFFFLDIYAIKTATRRQAPTCKSDRSASATIWWIAAEFGADVYGPHRMKAQDLSASAGPWASQTFHLAGEICQ